jgi:hypothetical protein
MKNIFFRYGFVILLVGVIISHYSRADAQAKSDFSKLKLEISTLKDSYLLIEPIIFKFRISNPTNQDILGHTGFNITSNFTSLVVRNESGEETTFNGFSPLPKLVAPSIRPIKPGESQEVVNILNYRLKEMFPFPGRYEIRAIFSNWRKPGKAFSNVITVEILAPEQTNKEAFDFINQSNDSVMFFTGSSDLKKREQRWREFLLKYEDTVYADYVTYALGQYLFYKGDIQESQKLLESVSKKQNFIFAKQVKNYLIEIRKKLDKDFR